MSNDGLSDVEKDGGCGAAHEAAAACAAILPPVTSSEAAACAGTRAEEPAGAWQEPFDLFWEK